MGVVVLIVFRLLVLFNAQEYCVLALLVVYPLPHRPHLLHGHVLQYTKKVCSTLSSSSSSCLVSISTVKEASIWTGRVGVIVTGILVFSGLSYAIIQELISPLSSTTLFSNAMHRLESHQHVVQLIGLPMSGFGEPATSRMQRHRRIACEYIVDSQGRNHAIMRFYIQGDHGHGRVYLDAVQVCRVVCVYIMVVWITRQNKAWCIVISWQIFNVSLLLFFGYHVFVYSKRRTSKTDYPRHDSRV